MYFQQCGGPPHARPCGAFSRWSSASVSPRWPRWRRRTRPGASTAVAAASPTPLASATLDEILAAIPASAGTSQSATALAEKLGKVREKPAEAVAWVELGDALAQVMRDTDNRKYYALAEQAYAHALKVDPRQRGCNGRLGLGRGRAARFRPERRLGQAGVGTGPQGRRRPRAHRRCRAGARGLRTGPTNIIRR